jgi:hypothetical protein
MIVRRVMVAARDVVFLKSVLEAYPGLAAVHAERARTSGAAPSRASLVIATTDELAGELDEVLAELAQTIHLSILPAQQPLLPR